jgi:predicted GNAT family acetyltransferase
MDEDDIRITRNDDAGRYELFVGDRLVSIATFQQTGTVVAIPHTETNPAFGGRGLAGRLVRHVLDDIKAGGLEVAPWCPFVSDYIVKHPEYADLVA